MYLCNWLSFLPFLVADYSGGDFEAVLEFVRRIYWILTWISSFRDFPFRDNLQHCSQRQDPVLGFKFSPPVCCCSSPGGGEGGSKIKGGAGRFRFEISRSITNNIGIGTIY